MALHGNSIFPVVRYSKECLACVLVRIGHSEDCLAHPFITSCFVIFAVLMLLWLLVEQECGGVMLAGLWGCSAGLIWWDVFQCGAPHNDDLSSSCLSCFFRGSNRNKIDIELHGSVTSEISCPLLLFSEVVYCCWQPRMLCCCWFEWEYVVVCGPFWWGVGALVLLRVRWCTSQAQLLLLKTLLLWWAGQWWGQRHCCVGLWHRMTWKSGIKRNFGLLVS